MAAIVMDGKALAAKVKERVRRQVEQLDIKPGLAVVLVGDDPASRVYVNGKKKDCGECGGVRPAGGAHPERAVGAGGRPE